MNSSSSWLFVCLFVFSIRYHSSCTFFFISFVNCTTISCPNFYLVVFKTNNIYIYYMCLSSDLKITQIAHLLLSKSRCHFFPLNIRCYFSFFLDIDLFAINYGINREKNSLSKRTTTTGNLFLFRQYNVLILRFSKKKLKIL
jgi:hypothetical protein